jgi:hypothetical protein
MDETEGLVKIVADAKTDRLIGMPGEVIGGTRNCTRPPSEKLSETSSTGDCRYQNVTPGG